MLRCESVVFNIMISLISAFWLSTARAQGAVDSTQVAMPALEFKSTPIDEGAFDKYFYFHRPKTTFATALKDLQECDNLASGRQQLGSGFGIVGGVVFDLVVGSSLRRKMRRGSMRRCMNYKGYERYGISKSLWSKFNFEEGVDKIDELQRGRYIEMQAKVAADGVPSGRVLGL